MLAGKHIFEGRNVSLRWIRTEGNQMLYFDLNTAVDFVFLYEVRYFIFMWKSELPKSKYVTHKNCL